jgi:ATP-binding cassette subfamily B protein
MVTTEPTSDRRRQALRRATRDYLHQLALHKRVAIPALLLPGLGNVLSVYVPPLVVARVLDAYARRGGPHVGLGLLTPYLLLFGLVWLAGEVMWRLGIHFLNRMDSRGIERLYLEGMEALLAKDLAFFQDNFAGSITKKVVGYAKSFEEFGDTVSFRIVSSFLPLVFITIVLWRFSPLLPLTLLAWMALTIVLVMPLIRRRQALVDEREEAGNRAAGHVADSITNMEAVRAFAREPFEYEVHHDNVRRYTRLMLRSWDYHNRVIDLVTMPLYVLTNLSGVVIAVLVGGDGLAGLRAVFVTFTFYAAFGRVLWDLNQI